jgi:putative aldouronate transport system substrate-binding protein
MFMKRVLSLTLCIILVVSFAVISTGITSAPSIDIKKPLTVSIAFGSPEGMDQDDMGKYIQKKFNMKIKYVSTGSAENDKIKVMAAAGNLPDAFGSDLGDSIFQNLKKEGMIREIPDKIMNKFPNVKKMVGMNAATTAFKKSAEGKLYGIPKPNNADFSKRADGSLHYYRADWMKKLGKTEPKTVDELYDLLKAFTFNDPDGNGKADTFGMTGWIWALDFCPWIDYYGWVKEGDKWIPGYVSDRMKPALAFFNKLYKEKILDPEFAQAERKQKFFSGVAGYMAFNGEAYWLYTDLVEGFQATNPKLNYKEVVKVMPPLKKDAKSQPTMLAATESAVNVFSKKCTDEMLTRVLMFFEWSLSPEGRNFQNYGFKDKDYVIKNGKVVSKLPMDSFGRNQMTIWERYPSQNIFGLLAWHAYSPIPAEKPSIPLEFDQWETKIQKEVYGPYVVMPNFDVNFISTPAKEKFNISRAEIEAQIQKMISSKDAVADFEKWRTKVLKVNKLQKVIDEVNVIAKQRGLK